MAFATVVLKLKVRASISATIAKPRTVICNITKKYLKTDIQTEEI